MKSDRPGESRKTIWDYGKIFILNNWRRAIILGRYSLICWQQQKLRRACRRLGAQILTALQSGEVNPLLTEGVKDTLETAKGIKGVKDRHYQAIAALKEKIRAAGAGEVPPPREETHGPQEAPGQPGDKAE